VTEIFRLHLADVIAAARPVDEDTCAFTSKACSALCETVNEAELEDESGAKLGVVWARLLRAFRATPATSLRRCSGAPVFIICRARELNGLAAVM